MTKFIHAADIHLDGPLVGLEKYEGAPINEIRSAARNAFENLIELAISEKVNFVLIVGDLFDGELHDYNSCLYFSKQMSRLKDENIKVFIVSGNHDAASPITKNTVSMPENVRYFSTQKPETILLEDIDVALHGFGFGKQKITDNVVSSFPKKYTGMFNIGLLHTSVTGREGHDTYAPCKVDDLNSKDYQYWALGHAHKLEILNKDPMIVFPGTIQGRNIRETGPKGCVLVSINEGKPSIDFQEIDVLRWSVCNVDTEGQDHPEDIILLIKDQIKEYLGKVGNRLIVTRVNISGACKAHEAFVANPEKWKSHIWEMANEFNDRVWIQKINFNTKTPLDLKSLINKKGPLGDMLSALEKAALFNEAIELVRDDIEGLKRKLSPVCNLDELTDIDSPEHKKVLCEDVKQILVSRLISSGGEE